MTTGSTFNFNRILSHCFRDEKGIDRALVEGLSQHHFTVRCPRLWLDQFTKESVHHLPFSVQFNFTHQCTCIVDKFSNARFIGIANIEMCFCNLFGNFMMEIFVTYDVIFRCTWTTDDNGLNVLKVWQPIRTSMFSSSLEEIMSCFFDQALKTLCGLTTLAVLAHDVGYEMLLNVDALTRSNPVCCF